MDCRGMVELFLFNANNPFFQWFIKVNGSPSRTLALLIN